MDLLHESLVLEGNDSGDHFLLKIFLDDLLLDTPFLHDSDQESVVDRARFLLLEQLWER